MMLHRSSAPSLVLASIATVALWACGKTPPKPPPATTAATATAPPDAALSPPDAAAAGPDAAAVPVDAPAAPGDAASADGASAERKLIPTTSKSAEALAEFRAGEALAYNQRSAEALARAKKALELDPELVQAQTMVGILTPGPDGSAMLDKAAQAATSLPEAERLWVEVRLAGHKGDAARLAELTPKLLEAAADDWRVHEFVCTRAFQANDLETAMKACQRATELGPEVGAPFNILGYAYLLAGKKDEAVTAFKRYAELSPGEPNPHDSLADALLAAGRLAEAEASYRKAVEVSPTFVMSWEGVANVRALSGDWKGAEEALAKAVADAPDAETRVTYKRVAAWFKAAQGDLAGASQALEALEKEAAEAKLTRESVWTGHNRANLLMYGGKLEEAEKAAAAVLARIEASGEAPSASVLAGKRRAIAILAMTAARLGKAEEAKKHLAALDELVKALSDDAWSQALVKRAHHAVQYAGDAKAAAAALPECLRDDSECVLYEVEVREQAGDKEGAEAARKKLVDNPRRDTIYTYVRARLGTIPAAK